MLPAQTISGVSNSLKQERHSTDHLPRQYEHYNEILEDIHYELSQTVEQNELYQEQVKVMETIFDELHTVTIMRKKECFERLRERVLERRNALEEKKKEIEKHLQIIRENVELQNEMLEKQKKNGFENPNEKKHHKEKWSEIEKAIKSSAKQIENNLKVNWNIVSFTHDKKKYQRLLNKIKQFGDITITLKKDGAKLSRSRVSIPKTSDNVPISSVGASETISDSKVQVDEEKNNEDLPIGISGSAPAPPIVTMQSQPFATDNTRKYSAKMSWSDLPRNPLEELSISCSTSMDAIPFGPFNVPLPSTHHTADQKKLSSWTTLV
ncbi:hypothetical protein RFI_22047 [Reticulomyxa filosa]|uniref:Uncharacterized protein n=1 Tax=Reticulomyxa filosa TaxID=46433 RepID=X6MNT8_RETFI|nr:hypothetical protein RFI_22047 [Reticulomyxa filosa]|eukprot:ETO15321.1 hypothetical protein RFI_22047 [Reticulomyxa filosa]